MIFQKIKSFFEKRFHPSQDPSETFTRMFGARSETGVDVTDDTAMTLTAVFGAVRIISETVASLPCFVYKRLKVGKERDPEHPLFKLLHDQPNPEMSAMSFREGTMAWTCLRGNGYAEIERDGMGLPKALWPIAANRVTVYRVKGRLQYHVTISSGETRVLFADEILHIHGFSRDGIVGLSPIAYARESIGLGLAAQEYGARLFANNTTPKGVIEYPGKFKNQDTLNRLKEQIESAHRGLTNSHRMLILEEGMKWAQTGIAPEDAQFLQSRKFQIAEIARIFRIPPHMLGDLERATFTNIEHQSIDFVVHTIRPWLVRWEQEIMRSLLLPSQQKTHFAEFNVDALLRGDIKSRYDAHAVGIRNGWLNADEVRQLENMNPIPDGKGQQYMVPLNMAPAGGEPSDPPDGTSVVKE